MFFMQNGDQVAGGGMSVIHITQEQYDANPSAYDDPNVLVHITNAQGNHLQGGDVAYDSNISMEDVGNIATKSLGKVEYRSDDVALYAHAVGEYFINKDGEYCKCISAISVGQTLTKNTNYTVTDIASEIKGTNTELSNISDYEDISSLIVPIGGSVTINNKYAYRYGKRVHLEVWCTATQYKPSSETYLLLPTRYLAKGATSSWTKCGSVIIKQGSDISFATGYAKTKKETYGATSYASITQAVIGAVDTNGVLHFFCDYIID